VKIPVGHTVNLLRGPLQAIIDPDTRNATDIANAALGAVPLSPQIDPGKNLLETAAFTGISGLNPLARVPVEQLMNRDTFRDVPIVSRRLESVEPSQQFTPMTSTAARAAGRVTGASPQRIEHAVRGALGGLGEVALGVADTLVGAPEGTVERKPVTDIPGLRQVTEAPIIGGVARPIARRFVGGPSSVDAVTHAQKERFYEALNRSSRVKATFNLALERGDKAKLKQMLSDPTTKKLIALSSTLNTMSQTISELRKAGKFDAERRLVARLDAMLKSLEK
jgi:hypothetical protein